MSGVEVDFTAPSGPTGFAAATLIGLVVDGGERGVHGHGPLGCSIQLESAVVRNQTVASVSYGQPGCGASLIDTSLSVLSGRALEDLRTEFPFPDRPVQALGVTLNGNSYAGQLVRGPLSRRRDFRIVGPGEIQF